MGKVAPRGLLKFVEVKAIVGGVTAIQGSAKLKGVYDGWLARNVEDESFGTGTSTVFQNVRPLGKRDFDKARSRMVGGNSYLYHLAEGTSSALLREFDDLDRNDCLQPGLVAIHATALGPSQFDRWGIHPGSLVWFPLSNLWLYRATTDVVAARDAGIRVCLGADWAPSGSKNLLGELKVADLWNRTALGGAFSDRELCEMVTANPADALSWGDRMGRLIEGRLADVVVIRRRHPDPYRNLIESTERDVRLVMVGGRPIDALPPSSERPGP